jgi:uncharacterized membrane protein YfcA
MADAERPGRRPRSTGRDARFTTRGLLLAALAILTPAGLVGVNIAAYVMAHLAAFRLAITVSSVVSALVLNTLAAVSVYSVARSQRPDLQPLRDSHRRSTIAVGAFVVSLIAALSGVLTYRGLSDPRQLPNASTFFAGLIGLLIPIVLALLLRENVSRRERRRFRTR